MALFSLGLPEIERSIAGSAGSKAKFGGLFATNRPRKARLAARLAVAGSPRQPVAPTSCSLTRRALARIYTRLARFRPAAGYAGPRYGPIVQTVSQGTSSRPRQGDHKDSVSQESPRV